ncbi:MAG: GNAT family N-acetyltransferase [Gammaproteobacteria bacterium]|nr:GNAT family N-acetyltransferase [Gammaproteobacteria bacterium]
MTRAGSVGMRFDANYREDVTLAQGLRVRLRTVTPADRQKLVEGFARLSAESRYRRFLSTKSELTDADLKFLTTPDGSRHVAIGAVDIGADGEELDGVGIGHLVRDTEHPEVAELALTVLDARQGMGIGRMLMVRLIAAAAERGVRRIRCHLLADNARMRGLIEPALGDTALTRDGDTMTGEFPVPATAEPEHVARDQVAAPLFGLLRLIAAGSVMPLDFTIAGLRYSIGSMALYSPSPESAASPESDAKDETGRDS